MNNFSSTIIKKFLFLELPQFLLMVHNRYLFFDLWGVMTHWPHAPPHSLQNGGVYIVTAGTYLKVHHFNTPERLMFLHDSLLSLAEAFGWQLHAWAVFSNHYHFVAYAPKDPSNLSVWIAKLHHSTAVVVNRYDQAPNRQVWHQFRDTNITIHTSYLARLNYVHQNPVKHGLVLRASEYQWCSANRFEMTASRSFVRSVYSFDYTKVKIPDDF